MLGYVPRSRYPVTATMPLCSSAGDCNPAARPAHLCSVTSTEEFTEFAAGAAPRLRRTAFLLCGDWHAAEDLVQATLTKMFVSWRRIRRQDAVYAYASRTLVNTYLADRRRLRSRELLAARLPERAAPAGTPELRMVILDALATLPPRARVVVVMRYWADVAARRRAGHRDEPGHGVRREPGRFHGLGDADPGGDEQARDAHRDRAVGRHDGGDA